MGILEGKTALIFGVANDKSIAWGIAQALHREGATLGFSYAGEILKKRVTPLAVQLGADFVEQCDVSKDEDLEAVFAKAGERFGKLDIVIHAVAFANKEELSGAYYNTSRAGFHLAMDISVFSMVAIVRHALPLMNPNGSFLTLTYYGAEKVVPNYNVMGVAKAALEASVRYLAADLGPQGLRVNAISAGPIRTLAAAGISSFRKLYNQFEAIAPLRRHVTIDDVGNVAAFLCSDWAAGVTGEVTYVDAGFNVVALPDPAVLDANAKSAEATG